jgi:hypothetical protein
MKHLKNYNTFNESTSYGKVNDSDEYEITIVTVDDNHDYGTCDGIRYELSGNDTIVNIEDIEHTEGNQFYQDQVDRYVEYLNDGGILETFPVSESSVCNNLDEMFEYLDDTNNFDEMYDLLKDYKTLYDLPGLYEIGFEPEDYGFNEGTEMDDIIGINSLNKYYKEDNENYDKDIYDGLVAIIKYFDDLKTYDLSDSNHRFMAVKELGVTSVLVEVMD